MLDKLGYRPNVGIVLVNHRNQVFWAKRANQVAWQFPQGGIQDGESTQQAMYRELMEEVGLTAQLVEILHHTQDWLYYDVPHDWVRKDENDRFYRGQKQIWYLLLLLGKDQDISIQSTTNKPEFDDWGWVDYWRPLQEIVAFKKGVYTFVLNEFASILGFPPK